MSWDTGLFPAFRISLKKCLFGALSLLVWGLEIAPVAFMVLRPLESIRTIQSVGGEGPTEDEMVGWHHQLNGHEFE